MGDMRVGVLVDFLTRGVDKVEHGKKALAGIAGVVGQAKRGFADGLRSTLSANNIDEAIRTHEQRLNRARGKLLDAAAMAMTIFTPVKMSAQFEDAFAEVDKVFQGSRERLADFKKFLLTTTSEIPVSAKGMAEILAEALQAGIPQETAEAFTKFTAKASVAFDMLARDTGENFAKIRNVYQLTQEGIERTGDAANHLSNNMAAKAPEIINFLRRAAGAAPGLGHTATEMAGLGTAFIAAGTQAEVASRAVNALSNRIHAGTGKNLLAAFEMIGLNRKEFSRRLKTEGVPALLDLLERVSKHEERDFIMKELAGQDFTDDFNKLLNNLGLLRQAYGLVAKEADYAGSVEDEFAKRLKTRLQQWQLAKNRAAELAITLGDIMLPTVQDGLELFGEMTAGVLAFSEVHPELTENVVNLTAGLLAFGVASRVLRYGMELVSGPLIRLISLFAKFDNGINVAPLSKLVGYLGGLGRAARLVAGAGAVAAIFELIRELSALPDAHGRAMEAAEKHGLTLKGFADIAGQAADKINELTKSEKARALSQAKDKLAELEADRKEVADLTDERAKLALRSAEQELERAERIRKASGREPVGSSGPFTGLSTDQIRQVRDLVRSFSEGDISAEDITARLYQLGETLRGKNAEARSELERMADQFSAMDQLTAKIREINDTIRELKKRDAAGSVDAVHERLPEPKPELPAASRGPVPRPKPARGTKTQDLPPTVEDYSKLFQGSDNKAIQKLETHIKAQLIDKRPPYVTVNAPISISGVTDPKAVAGEVRRQLGAAVSKARTGALHGGTE
ncbi:TP901 family phage tail tape measure protein [Rhodobium orientis]|uniref:Phage tail tape measure protein n=1 Tax=Rhodobium orientis TaxID=34017 RepID=A0A327JMP0_9HYPH|nr:phage tail tape measure protein [Rhodobium orientis]MBB4302365.1 TP901 family phage tail tape measure protein [Rhodobium orientis]MBK5949069.1 phage tail tape measure protein [Rhodobium orientis]RAI26604.1 phage tail tape measure protein [Rhodobium orientis]